MAALAARVAKLEGQIVAADIVGTYAVHGFQNELRAPNNLPPGVPTQVASYVFVGTVVLAADGTVSLGSVTENGHRLRFSVPPSVLPHFIVSVAHDFSTWTYADGAVTVPGGFPLSVTAGGRVLVGAGANPADGTDVLLILTRLL